MEEATIYISLKGDMRQYRISPNSSENRISDADGYRIGQHPSERVNFALSNIDKDYQKIKESIGEIGLNFLQLFRLRGLELGAEEQLVIVNAWTIIFLSNDQGPYLSKRIDYVIPSVIGQVLRKGFLVEQSIDPVGAVFL